MTALDAACQSRGIGSHNYCCGRDDGCDGGTGNNVDFPASSPHVLACGGTKLDANGATIRSEVVWNELATGGATAAGEHVFALPTWQANANVPKRARARAGAACPTWPETRSTTVTHSRGRETTVIGEQRGRSAMGRAGSSGQPALGTHVGFIQPAISAKAASAFNDITVATTGRFRGPGWDACTGLGPHPNKLIPLLTRKCGRQGRVFEAGQNW